MQIKTDNVFLYVHGVKFAQKCKFEHPPVSIATMWSTKYCEIISRAIIVLVFVCFFRDSILIHVFPTRQ